LAWLELLLRWLHVTAAVAWLGMVLVIALVERRVAKCGEAWLVDGDGCYRARRHDRAPAPAARFRAQAYTAWGTGFLLLLLVYRLPLVPRLLGLAWLVATYGLYEAACRLAWRAPVPIPEIVATALLVATPPLLAPQMPARAAVLHAGALAATMMVASLAHVVAPAQRHLLAGEPLDAARQAAVRERGRHIELLAAPTLLLMLAAHLPQVERPAVLWLAAPLGLALGATLRLVLDRKGAS
jgi:uncharacterized membrane protein